MASVWSLLARLLTRRRSAPRVDVPFDVTSTWEVTDPRSHRLHLRYAPRKDGIPDAGEVVWAWVPFQDDPTLGKDRPLLVIAPHDTQRVYALRLTSRPPGRDGRHLALGSGSWDGQGRPSWVDLDRLYSLHLRGIRREAAALDRRRFTQIARVAAERHGWRFDG